MRRIEIAFADKETTNFINAENMISIDLFHTCDLGSGVWTYLLNHVGIGSAFCLNKYELSVRLLIL